MNHTQWCMDSASEGCVDPSCARFAELKAELGARTAERDVLYRQCDELEGFFHYQVARADKAVARLAAVIALCDDADRENEDQSTDELDWLIGTDEVRAAAIGGMK